MKKLLIWVILCSICGIMPVYGQERRGELKTQIEQCAEIVIELGTELEEKCLAEYPDFQIELTPDELETGTLHADTEIYPQVSSQPQPEVKPAGNRWGIVLSPSEIDILARIVMLEAGGEEMAGQQAVTEVIFNRMVSSCYGGSLEHVLSAKGQFSTWKNRYSSRAVPSAQVLSSVMSVLNGETNILPLNTLYFSRKAQNKRIQTRIGRHVFCNQ